MTQFLFPTKYKILNTKYLVAIASFFVLSTTSALAQWQVYENGSIGNATGSNPGAATFKSLETVFANVIGILVPIAGISVFIMFVIGGYKFMFSGGDPQKNAAAKATLTWAIVGLLFLLGAWFILRFIQEFTGVNVTVFQIPD